MGTTDLEGFHFFFFYRFSFWFLLSSFHPQEDTANEGGEIAWHLMELVCICLEDEKYIGLPNVKIAAFHSFMYRVHTLPFRSSNQILKVAYLNNAPHTPL